MVKVYIEKDGAPELPMSLVFWPNFRFEISPKRLFLRSIMEQYQTPIFTVVATPEEADFFTVPFEFFDVSDRHFVYLANVYAAAKAAGKKVLLFDYTDYVDRTLKIPSHAILFRVSTYRHHKKENEIIMPYFVEDMGARHGITPKEKCDSLVVGYCGQSQFGGVVRKWRASLKWLLSYLLRCARRDTEPLAHRRGIFWRARARRFYEALSASRGPLLIDTDSVLPLEEIVAYDDVVLRVPSREIKTLPARVRWWSEKQTADSFFESERRAREVYERFLRLDRYFEIVFDRERSPYKEVLFQ
ncbi:MAG: Exostosin family protein [Parcubacteria group bacterium Greene0416_79]|nr:MAG: Exostosin family protein [Parcubacteria group bacterium Greene0416_79]